MRERVGLFLLFGTLAVAAPAAPVPDADALALAVRTNGAQAVINKLYDDRAAWNSALWKIGSGDHRWVSLAITLLARADAGAASELHDALFGALSRDPAYLLNQPSSQNFDPVEICRGRDDPPATYHDAEAEQLDARMKVAALEEDLHKRRTLCLAALDEGLRDLQRFFGVKRK